MSDPQSPRPTAPHCPVCAHQLVLKTIHRLAPADHFIFKCRTCALEYPIVAPHTKDPDV
jgi:hypothetical protein